MVTADGGRMENRYNRYLPVLHCSIPSRRRNFHCIPGGKYGISCVWSRSGPTRQKEVGFRIHIYERIIIPDNRRRLLMGDRKLQERIWYGSRFCSCEL